MKWVAWMATGCMLASAAIAGAEVNCTQVNKYLQTGRSVQDVAETMVIPEEEVKKCQEQAKPQGGTESSGTEASGEAGKKE